MTTLDMHYIEMGEDGDALREYLESEGIDAGNIIVNEDSKSSFLIAADYIDFSRQIFISLNLLSVEYLKMTRFPKRVEAMGTAWEEQDYLRHLSMLERRFYSLYSHTLLDLLSDLEDAGLTADEWWDLFTHVWIDSEYLNGSVDKDDIVEMFEQNPNIEAQRERLKERLNGNGKLVVYRGETPRSVSYKDGALSWTLSKEKAEWFARRFGSSGTVYSAEVLLSDVLAYFTERDEEEIIVHVEGLEVEGLEVAKI